MTTNLKISLDEIKEKVLDVGNGLLQANTLILFALVECDDNKFTEAKAHIKNIGSKTDEIDNYAIKTLALYSPEARDLRHVIAYLKITNELSRACLNTRSFIRGFTEACQEVEIATINAYSVSMQRSTVQAIALTISMLNCEDEDEIKEIYNDVLIEENKTDDLYEMVERNLSLQADCANNFEKFHKMLRALRKSGKIASRTISIANLVMYAKVGGNFHN